MTTPLPFGRVTRSHRRMELCDPLNLYQHIERLSNEGHYEDIFFLYELTNPKFHPVTKLYAEIEYKMLVSVAEAYSMAGQITNGKRLCELAFEYLGGERRVPKAWKNADNSFRQHLAVESELIILMQSKNVKDVSARCRYPATKMKGETFKQCTSAFGSAAVMLRRASHLGPFDTADLIGATVRGKGENNVRIWLKSQELAGKGLYEEAIAELLKMDPPSHRIFAEIADLQTDMGLLDEAILTLQKLQRHEPDCIERMDKLAYLMSKNLDRYREDLIELSQDMLNAFPDQPEAYTAMAFRARGAAVFHETPTNNGEFIISLAQNANNLAHAYCSITQQSYSVMALAFGLEMAKMRPQAIHILRQSTPHDTKNPDLREVLIDMYMRDEKKNEARELAQAYLNLYPHSVFAKYTFARISFRAKGVTGNEKAIRLLKECIEQQPRFLDAILLLVKQYLSLPQCKKGFGPLVEFLKKCRTDYTMKPKLDLTLGEVLLRTGQPVRAYEKLALNLDQALLANCLQETEKQLRSLIEINGEPEDFEEMAAWYTPADSNDSEISYE